MLKRKTLYISLLLVLNCPCLSAQRVLYCEPYSDRFTLRAEMAGRVGEYYWMQSTRKKRVSGRSTDPRAHEETTYDIYDNRMKLANTVPLFPPLGNTQKEYLVPGDNYFDQLALLGGNKKTGLFLQRYEADGTPVDAGRIIATLPFNESGNSFILVRSEDRSRILLLGFQSISAYPPRLHAILFDENWQPLYQREYVHPFITQPLIQDDYSNYPLEDFNSGPLKLANNGQWLMAAPSRTNANFLLFHFNATDTGWSYKEIRLPPASGMEDVNLSVNNERGEAFAAVLSTFHYDVLKNVQVVHYSMSGKSFDFDSSYRFSTLSGKVKDGNLTKESFIAVPGSGFMLLKEYGRPFTDWYDDGSYDLQWDPAVLFASNNIPDRKRLKPAALHDGYARYPALEDLGDEHGRGDLSMFYFPGRSADSCWSAMLSKEQTTELNASNLSYFVMPLRDRLCVMYNNFFRNENQYGTSTILDYQGGVHVDEGVMFWKFKNSLRFQQARQISESEVVIPYDNYGRTGYAVVRF